MKNKQNHLLRDEYYIEDCSKEILLSKNFKYMYEYKGYIYKFPVLKDKYRTTLEAVFCVFEENNVVNIDVYTEAKSPYSPFYVPNKGYKYLINKINNKILYEIKRLEIKKKERKGRR